MVIKIDFNSNQAIYIQLINSIILGIATDELHEGDALPSVRQLADDIGINMHTVNKAYSILRQEGYIKLDRRKGAVIAVDINKIHAMNMLAEEMQVVIAKALCRGISPEKVHDVVDDVMSEFLPERPRR